MYFLIDYENVKERGLEGAEYLSAEDHVVIFYSESTRMITNAALDKIIYSRCEMECYELVKSGQNALDFYICAKVGELFANGNEKRIAIISNDKGYRAVRDMYSKYSSGQQVILQGDIAGVITQMREDRMKADIIKYKRTTTHIKNAVERASFVRRIWTYTDDKYSATEFADKLDVVFSIRSAGVGNRELYLECLRQFGRKSGTLIYREFKENTDKIDVSDEETRARLEKEMKTRNEIEKALLNVLSDAEDRKMITDYIMADTSKTDVNNYMLKEFKGSLFRQVQKATRPFLKGKRGA